MPVLNTSVPLAPDSPAFDVCSDMAPLELIVLTPLRTVTDPPKDAEDPPVFPAVMDTTPPLPLPPDPTDKKIEPPRPDGARPEPTYTDPLSPCCSLDPEPTYTEPLGPVLDVPVLNITAPLTPRLPALEL